jgi:hypothetical protein
MAWQTKFDITIQQSDHCFISVINVHFLAIKMHLELIDVLCPVPNGGHLISASREPYNVKVTPPIDSSNPV